MPDHRFLAGTWLVEAEVVLQVMLDVLCHVGFAFVGICKSTILLFIKGKIPRNDPETDGLFIWPYARRQVGDEDEDTRAPIRALRDCIGRDLDLDRLRLDSLK
uniref:Uncharacterized protein n=1 Tax=Candidatus Kentrum sp. UNK TaxID=2126344 RepID=A0A451AYV6_9GAMM|nr:MAG: hypothetical protein BECKUNK1418G_GA0071005_10477 [Candidatus Kentron sp. UNK]VFK71107.1 MAG: hypothetical protein BECKUNK1418H_GA0071006_10517 [Candidatus Kentron sp. UNK]